ncbi:uncharacterized protein DEA37_0002402 [Paragonimus westermani]|uniref:Endonuclease/exonuclease/phosphatase domain-containing protein n=1 Tax=Paragonimus westermani TaxID=34504 RepID=A0A5J4NGR5_9TREM|nr:uncharacterized protein DEA37_0002402 [Paragonimus westermani]
MFSANQRIPVDPTHCVPITTVCKISSSQTTVQKARKSTAVSDSVAGSNSNGSVDSRELDRLKFLNPGKAMKELQFNWPEGNLTRNYRKQLASRHSQRDREKGALHQDLGRGMFAAHPSDCGPAVYHTDNTQSQPYNQLSAPIRSTQRDDGLFVLGDFNPRVGRDPTACSGVIGLRSVGSLNENGDCLLHLCTTQKLATTNTRFQLNA